MNNEYLKDDINETNAEIEELNDTKVEIDQVVAENRTRAESLEELYSDANKKLMASIDEINMLSNRAQVNNERPTAIDQNTERLTREISEAEEKLARDSAGAAEFAKTKEGVDAKLAALADVLNEKIRIQADITAENAAQIQRIDDMKNQVFTLHSRSTEKNAEISSLESLKANLDRRREALNEELASSETEKSEVLKTREKASEEVKALEDDLTALSIEIRKNKDSYSAKLSEERQLSRELEEAKLSLGQKSMRKKTIEEMESNYEGYNNAVKFVMRSGFSGIHGVVAELMQVPAGFETAIETALGATMQNVVCQSDKDAKYVIEQLKQNRAGRLTFLPLESVKGRGSHDSSIESEPGFKGYGTDCIDFDSKYEGIFEYLLGRVVVVDNMDHAIRLSKKAGSLRYVTLEGEIINAGGAITGGKYKNNTANLLERKAEIAKLDEELARLTALKNSCSQKLETLRGEIENFGSQSESLNQRVKEVEMKLLTRKNQLEVLDSVIADSASDDEKRNRELGSIDSEKNGADEMIARLRTEIEAAKAEVAKLEETIEKEIADGENGRARLEAVSEEITKARIDVTAAEGEKTAADQMAQRIQSEIDLLEAQIDEKKAERESLLAQRTTLTGELNVDDIVREKEDARRKLEEYISDLAEEKATVTAGLNADSARKDKIDEKLKELQDKKFQLELKQGKQETQLENFKERLWNEFEVTYLQAMEFKKHGFNMAGAERESRKIAARMKELGEVNIGAIKEYASVSERLEFLTAQRADVLKSTNDLKEIIFDLEKNITERFRESFDGVVANFDGIFKELFGGGHAELRLDDPDKPLESGIDIIAQPPGKKLQNINLLSGGEKTMTAIALMFAVLKHKPTPFCILDEVEAALDEANIDRFSDYLRNFDDIQFALVTHQKTTMEHADVLYGVTMPEQGVSKVISLKLGDDFDLE